MKCKYFILSLLSFSLFPFNSLLAESCEKGSLLPRILEAKKVGNYYSDEFIIKGDVSKKCVSALELYQNGVKVREIKLLEGEGEQHKNFRVKVDASYDLKLQTLTFNGKKTSLIVDVLDYR